MTTVDASWKKGDTYPPIKGTVRDGSEAAVPLGAGDTVRFLMSRKPSGAPKIAVAATIDDGPNGVVRYDWQAGDLDTPGIYYVEFEVTLSSGKKFTAPNDGYRRIRVRDDLD